MMPLLLHSHDLGGGFARRREWRFANEEAVVVKISVHVSGNLSRLGAEGWVSTLQEDHYHDASEFCIGVGAKPSEASAVFGAGAGFSQHLFFAEVVAHAARRAELNRSRHAVRNF